MSNIQILSEGLVISLNGSTYEFRCKIHQLVQFECINTGEILSITESQFFEDWKNQVITILPASSTPKELSISPCNLTTDTLQPSIIDLSALPNDKAKEAALLRIKYVRHMRMAGITRGRLELLKDEIPRAAIELNDPKPPAFSTVSRWMREFDRNHGDVVALFDSRTMSPRRHSRRSSEHDNLIRDIIDDRFMKEEPDTIPFIYDTYQSAIKKYNLECSTNNLSPETPISERTLYRIIDSIDKYDVAVAQLGYAEANRQFRFIRGHLRSRFPLEYVEIDHALLDIFVIDDRLFIPLGRPWLTVIRDRFSGAIIGLYISFSGPSTDSIFGALRHSLYPHTKIREKWPDIETELPWGLATTYVTDRGSDFLSIRYRLAVNQLGSDYEYCAVRTPWFKAPVERSFRTVSSLLETMPGKTFPRLSDRRDYDPAKHCVVRFSSFVWILYKWACDIYNNKSPRRKLAPPIDLFSEGIERSPRTFPRDPAVVETLLGHRYTGILRHDGITRDYLSYGNSHRLDEIYKWRGSSKNPIVYHRNNSNLGEIRVMDPRNNEFFSVPCLSPDYANGLTLLQHKQIREAAKADLIGHPSIEIFTRARDAIQEQIREELERKNNSSKKKIARYAGINSDQVLNGQHCTIQTFFPKESLTQEQQKANDDQPHVVPPVSDIQEYGWMVL